MALLVAAQNKLADKQVVDDYQNSRVEADTKRMLDVGTIVVEVHRLSSRHIHATKAVKAQHAEIPAINSVSEKARGSRISLEGKVSQSMWFPELIKSSRSSRNSPPFVP